MAFEEPHLPTTAEIRARAIELFQEEFIRTHPGEVAPDPEDEELREDGFWDRAKHELMTGAKSQIEEMIYFYEDQAKQLRKGLGMETEVTPERLDELRDTISDLRKRYGEAKRSLKKAEGELEESRLKVEELEKRPVKEIVREIPKYQMTTVKFLKAMPSFVGADMKRYGPFSVGEIDTVPEGNAAVLVEKGIAQIWTIPQPTVPRPTPVPTPRREEKKEGLTAEQLRILKAKFNVTIMDTLLEKGLRGRIPPNSSSIFLVELDKVKDKSYDEIQAHLVTVARQIAERETTERQIREAERRITPPRRVIEPYRPPLEPIGEPEEIIFWTRPAYPFPSEPLSKRRWPSRPTGQEADALWEYFAWRLAERGFYPDHKLYRDAFEKFIASVMFPSYSSLLKIFNALIEHIVSGADVGTFAVKLAPIYEMTMPWRPEKIRYDAILMMVRWAASSSLTIDDVIDELAKYGIYTDAEEIIEVTKEGWKERNTFIYLPDGTKMAHWLMFIYKNELENVLKVPVE